MNPIAPSLGIAAVAAYIPDDYLDNLERAPALDAGEDLLRDKIGVLKVSRKHADEETSDLAVKAVRRLFEQGAARPEQVDCLVVVTQNPDGYGLPHTSARVHGKLGLPTSCAVFDLSLGCSGYVYGLSVITALMQAQGLRCGLLVTADPYSKIINPHDRNTSLLFGDAAAATLITDRPQWRIGRFDLGSDGSFADDLAVPAHSHYFHMNGRAVLNFSARKVPESILHALEINGVALGEVDRFLLHQGSRHVVHQIARRLGVPDEKAPFLATDYGNTVSSSIPLLLTHDLIRQDRCVVLSGFGVGISWGSTVLWRV
jgi:3-oxoacyl-[acyl-carrier-protein] synthase-3